MRQKKIITFLYALVAFTIPYGFFYKVNNIAIIVLLLVSFFFFLKERPKIKKVDLLLLLPIIYFLLLLISIAYSQDVSFAFKQLEKSTAFLAFPIAGIINRRYFSKQLVTYTTASFVISNILGLLFCYALGLLDFDENVLPITKGSFYLTEYLNIHPSYFSMYLVFCFGVCVHIFTKEKFLLKNKTLIQISVYLFLAFSIFFLKSRAGLISFAIVFMILLFQKVKKKSHKVILGVSTTILVLFCSLSDYGANNYLLNRDIANATDERVKVWSAAYRSIDDVILFGHGLGDSKHALDKQFFIDGFDIGIDKGYNAHNQYLEALLSGGIWLLLIVLIMLGVFFVMYQKSKNIAILACFISLLIGMFFESILVRQHGIIFFSFFYSVFCIKNNTPIRKFLKIGKNRGLTPENRHRFLI